MKQCRRCAAEKSVADFYADKRTPDGLRLWCKDCWNAYSRQRWADGRTDRAKRAVTNAAWRKANPERIAVIGRRSKLKREFGLLPGQYEAMLAGQGGGCAACGSVDNGDRRFDSFVVDHDHATGAVRGLLCSPCNKALGQVKDDPDRLISLAAYLLQHRNVLGEPLGAST